MVFRYIFLLLVFILPFAKIKSQSVFHTWPTLDIQGEIFDDIEVKLEYRNKYDNSARESKQGRIDFGIAYKMKKLKAGIYYREIYDVKKDGRVSELRPHLDLTYKLNDNMKIRYRNEFRIKELDDNVFRHRLRYSYSLKVFDNYNPFIQNRINIGLSIKFKKTPFSFKPSYILESNRKVSGESISWSQKNVFVLAVSIKL